MCHILLPSPSFIVKEEEGKETLKAKKMMRMRALYAASNRSVMAEHSVQKNSNEHVQKGDNGGKT
jgi:hypothetical protein